jgi:hypothetical protein
LPASLPAIVCLPESNRQNARHAKEHPPPWRSWRPA